MKKYNSKNERIKHDYYKYLAEADGKSSSTIDGVRKSLLRYEEQNKFKDFSSFNKEQAIAFKKNLNQTKAKSSGKVLSKATVSSTLNHLKAFLKWLAQQPGYKSKIHLPDINYLNLTDKENRIAKTSLPKKFPTIEQIRKVVLGMPSSTEIEKRNQAMIAFTILTGVRVQALVSLKIKHFDVEQKLITQDPREVNTKFSKSIHTYLLPIGDEFQDIFLNWINFLQTEKLYGYDAPLFPRTALTQNKNYSFKPNGLEPIHWSTTSPVRTIFKEAFESQGLPYYNPHSFRHTLGHLMQRRCNTVEEILAWSQNLGHESPVTTFTSYGHIDLYRQGDILKLMK